MQVAKEFGVRWRDAGDLALGALLTFATADAGRAAEETVRRPKVAFTGDLIVQRPGEPPHRIRLYHDVLRTRMDVPYPEPRLVTIADRERGVALVLLPHRREFVKLAGGAQARAMADRMLAARGGLESLGPDNIRGIAVTKFALVTRTAAGTDFEGHVWLTDDNIMIRTAGRTPKGRIEITMNNLRRGPIDPALFAIPTGYVERKPDGR